MITIRVGCLCHPSRSLRNFLINQKTITSTWFSWSIRDLTVGNSADLCIHS